MNNQFETDWSKWKLLGLVILLQAGSFTAGLYSGHTYWSKPSVQVIQPNYSTTETSPPDTQTTTTSGSTCQSKEIFRGRIKFIIFREGHSLNAPKKRCVSKRKAKQKPLGLSNLVDNIIISIVAH